MLSYCIQIERIGSDGLPEGDTIIEIATSEGDAYSVLQRTIEVPLHVQQAMQLSIFGPDNQLLIHYNSDGYDKLQAVPASA
nr:hypothetical protein [Methylobacterium sp. L1A1]